MRYDLHEITGALSFYPKSVKQLIKKKKKKLHIPNLTRNLGGEKKTRNNIDFVLRRRGDGVTRFPRGELAAVPAFFRPPFPPTDRV